jgi:hypothetical protein
VNQTKPFGSLQSKSQRLLRVQEQVTLWEERFREARTPKDRYEATGQLRRWTENHPLIRMWVERDPRLCDLTWTLPR